MKCKNKEKFPISIIMFDQTYVKDNDGNILFKLNNYINQKQFSCVVGILDSEKVKSLQKSSKQILAIIVSIISLVIIAAMTIILLYFSKKEELFCWKKKEIIRDIPHGNLKKIESISNDLEKDSDKSDKSDQSKYNDSTCNIMLNKKNQ